MENVERNAFGWKLKKQISEIADFEQICKASKHIIMIITTPIGIK